MRLLLVSDFFPPVQGGLEFHVDTLASALAERGDEVHIATLTRNAKPTDSRVTVHVVQARGVRLLPHEDRARPFHPPVSEPTAWRALRAIIAMVAPDLIHGHGWLASSLPAELGCPFVYTAHDYGLICQLRTLWQSSCESSCSGPGGLKCVRCARATVGTSKAVLLSLGTRLGRAMLSPDRVIAVSETVRLAIQPFVSVPVSVCYGFPGPSVDYAEGYEFPFVEDLPVVMFAGDPGSHKGLPILLEAWNLGGAPEANLLIATTKPLRNPGGDRIGVCQLSRREVLAAWNKADVAVVPSQWQEPLGTVALEALASRAALVVSGTGGLRELVRDGVECLYAEPGSAESLRLQIDRLLADDSLRLRLVEAGVKRLEEFSRERCVEAVLRVYASVLQGDT